MTEMGNFGMGAVGVESAMLPLPMPGATPEKEQVSFESVLDSLRDDAASDRTRFAGDKDRGGRGEVSSRECETAKSESSAIKARETNGEPEATTPGATEEPARDEVPPTADESVETSAEETAQVCAEAAVAVPTEAAAEAVAVEGAVEVVTTDEPIPVDLPLPDSPQAGLPEEAKLPAEGVSQAVAPGAIFEEGAPGEAAKPGAEVVAQGDAGVVALPAGEPKAASTGSAQAEGNPMLEASRAEMQTQQAEGMQAAEQKGLVSEVAADTAQSAEGVAVAPSVPDGSGVGTEGEGLMDNGAGGTGEVSVVHGEIGQTDGIHDADFAGKLDRAHESVRANQPEAIERMVKAMRVAFEKGESRVRIMLNPPELGSVRVNMSLKDGVLNASFEAQNQAARHALAHDLPMLRDALENHGIEVGEFSVNVENGETGSQAFDKDAVDSPGYASGAETAGASVEDEDEPYDILAEQRRIIGGTAVLDLIA